MSTTPFRQSASEQWQRIQDQLPESERNWRVSSLNRFLASGLPHRKQEAWRHTDLSKLEQRDFVTPPAPASETMDIPVLPGYVRIVYRNGCLMEGPTQAPIQAQTTESEGVQALNAALASDGLNLDIEGDTNSTQYFHVIVDARGDGAPFAVHQRHKITVSSGANALVLMHYLGDGDYLTTQSLDVELAANARLHLIRLQDEDAAQHLARTAISVGEKAHVKFSSVELGGALVRHDLNVALQAGGAEVELAGLNVPSPNGHIDLHVLTDHQAEQGRSRMLFRGLAGGTGRIVLNGAVRVGHGACKTDSDQQLAHLLLSRKAEIDAKPELVIFNDDVRCSHGSTSGQLDSAALFYLRSRGIENEAARRLLVRAFATIPLASISEDSVRALIDEVLDRRFSALLATMEMA